MITHLILDPLTFLYGMAIFFLHEHITRVFVSGHLYQERTGTAIQLDFGERRICVTWKWLLLSWLFKSKLPPSYLICVQHQNCFCLPLSSRERAYSMVRRCEHFTEISRWQQLSSTWGAVVMDAGEGMCRRFEPSDLENWGNRRQGCCPSPVKKICHFNTTVAASLFTSGRCPGIFDSTSRLLQLIFQRHEAKIFWLFNH